MILMRREWDKCFDEKQFQFEEPEATGAMISEKQEKQNKREREVRFGKILWSSLAFVLYTALYVTIILSQLGIERNFVYNTSMKTHIQQLGLYEEFGLGLKDVSNYNEVIHWLEKHFINLGGEKPLPATLDSTGE